MVSTQLTEFLSPPVFKDIFLSNLFRLLHVSVCVCERPCVFFICGLCLRLGKILLVPENENQYNRIEI